MDWTNATQHVLKVKIAAEKSKASSKYHVSNHFIILFSCLNSAFMGAGLITALVLSSFAAQHQQPVRFD